MPKTTFLSRTIVKKRFNLVKTPIKLLLCRNIQVSKTRTHRVKRNIIRTPLWLPTRDTNQFRLVDGASNFDGGRVRERAACHRELPYKVGTFQGHEGMKLLVNARTVNRHFTQRKASLNKT